MSELLQREAKTIKELLEKTKIWVKDGLKSSKFPITKKELLLIPDQDHIEEEVEISAEASTQELVPANTFDWLIDEIAYYWNKGLTAKEIFKEMQFGKYAPENGGFPDLQVRHIYYFVKKYGKEYGIIPRKKQKKKEKEVQVGVPHTTDMPFEVAHYLRKTGQLVE